MFNPSKIIDQFPVFKHYPNLIFADNASTTQKPISVIDAIQNCYLYQYANIHRAVYDLGFLADEVYENTRKKILNHFQLIDTHKAVFHSGTTDGINQMARSIEELINEGENIVLSEMEHHSNFLPWQELAIRKGIELRIIPLKENGELETNTIKELVNEKTRIVALVHVSNTLGTVNNIEEIRSIIGKKDDIVFLVDAAQSAAFHARELKRGKPDIIVFSGHKMFGPSGIGVSLIENKCFENLNPSNFGGGMVNEVNLDKSNYRENETKFEAGTPPIAQVFGLNAAIDFLNKLEPTNCRNHINHLTGIFREQLENLKINYLGNPGNYSGVTSVVFNKIHPHDAASFLNTKGIAVRAGHHCTQLIMKKYGVPATVRFSFTIYNTEEHVRYIIASIKEMINFFHG